MAFITNLLKIFKTEGKAVEKAVVKSSASDIVKTTSEVSGSSEKVVSGGQVVAKSESQFMKGVGSTANVGGKVVAGTGYLAIPVGAGLYGLDLFKNTLARNNDYYNTKDSNANYKAETENLKSRIGALQDLQNTPITDVNTPYLAGGSTQGADTNGSNLGGMSPYALLGAGILVLGIGAYAYTNKRKK